MMAVTLMEDRDFKGFLETTSKELTQDSTEVFNQDNSNVGDLIKLTSEMMVTKPKYIIFPSDIETKTIQRCIINFNRTHFVNGPNGKKRQYARWLSYSLGIFYKKRVIYDRVPFVIQLPFKSWANMFYRSAGINFAALMQSMYEEHNGNIPLMEIHFKKKTDCMYELKFLAIVKYELTTTDFHQFKRMKILFKESGHSSNTPGVEKR